MRTAIIAAALLALAAPAHARDYALWDCGHGFEASAGKSGRGVSFPENYKGGTVKITWKPRKNDVPEITVNGKACIYRTPRYDAYLDCVRDDDCSELENGWGKMLTKAEKHAVEKSKHH